MSGRQRLRTRGGCATCKRRRKKCDEEKPICGACRRLFLRCSWTSATTQEEIQNVVAGPSDTGLDLGVSRSRQRSTVPKSIDLSAFRGQVCAAHVLETCFKATNLSFDPVHTESNGSTMQATLSFAPMDTSLAWSCIVALGLLFVGHRYQDQGLVNASDLQHVEIVSKVRLAVENGVQAVTYDTLAAIALLGPLSVTRFWFGKSSREDEGVLHGIGLSAVLEAMHPEQFQTAQALALFEYTRFTVVMSALLSGRPTCLVSEPWRTVPWARARHNKGSLHVLMDLICDIIPLQSEMNLIGLVADRSEPTAPRVREKVGSLLSQLHNWRTSFEPGLSTRLKTIDLAGQSTLVHTGAGHPIQFERPNDLFQLGLFNMVLIYLCRFLPQCSVNIDTTSSTTQHMTLGEGVSERHSILPTTPLVLPIRDPVARSKVAAKEINIIWRCLCKDGLFGCATFYLVVPLIVAKILLAQEGDATASDLNEAIDRIPAIWAGRN